MYVKFILVYFAFMLLTTYIDYKVMFKPKTRCHATVTVNNNINNSDFTCQCFYDVCYIFFLSQTAYRPAVYNQNVRRPKTTCLRTNMYNKNIPNLYFYYVFICIIAK